MLQKYELGTKVWCFKQQGQGIVKAFGIVQAVELDKSGYFFYKIMTGKMVNGEFQTTLITANHASLAHTESELDEKIEKYTQFQNEQKKKFEDNFGVPEFTPDYVESTLKE